MGHETPSHLTVYFARNIEADYVENYGHKAAHACKGVNL
jgi:hypothetical protein